MRFKSIGCGSSALTFLVASCSIPAIHFSQESL